MVLTWTSRTSAADNSWNNICFGNGLFVAISTYSGSTDNIMTSSDGITWTSRTSALDIDWYGICYANGLFVAVASEGSGDQVMTSGFQKIDDLVHNNQYNGVYKFTDSIYTNKIQSVNAYLDTIQSSSINGNPDIDSINVGFIEVDTINGNPFIDSINVGSITGTEINNINIGDEVNGKINDAGITWTSRTSAADNSWNSVCYGNGLFVAVASSGTGNRVMTSPDGINWTSGTCPDSNWTSVCYGNGQFVAVGDGEDVIISPDGINWTLHSSGKDESWTSVCYGNDRYVAVGVTGVDRAMYSFDGIIWNYGTTSENNYREVCYGNGQFVAVSSLAVAMTSPDGITWTNRTYAGYTYWESICYGNGLYVAVASVHGGPLNHVMTSPDGITWTNRTPASNVEWNGICFGNGIFVAVSGTGTGNRVMTSPDGENWTSRTSAADLDWQSVCYGNGLFVAVSGSGTDNRVMTSGFQKIDDLAHNNQYNGATTFTGNVTFDRQVSVSGRLDPQLFGSSILALTNPGSGTYRTDTIATSHGILMVTVQNAGNTGYDTDLYLFGSDYDSGTATLFASSLSNAYIVSVTPVNVGSNFHAFDIVISSVSGGHELNVIFIRLK